MSNGNINMSAKGRFGLSVLDKNGKVKKEKSLGNTSNVVTYGGAYEALINGNNSLFGIYTAYMGTGTAEITREATSLGARSFGDSNQSSRSRSGTEVDNLDGTSTFSLTRTMTFPLGSKVGTFSEVGVYTPFSGEVFIAGQLIKDEFGNPTTITILADEQLVVTYILEWTVPNVAQLIGTGSVTDADSNVYNYEVYSQPYFTEYSVGSSSSTTRYSGFSSWDEIGFYAADGVTPLYYSGDRGDGFSSNIVHDGLGTVTYTTNTEVFAPNQGGYSGLTYISFYPSSSTSVTGSGILDTTTNIAYDSTNSDYPLLIKFVDPITKLTSQSFTIAASFTVTL